jgi:hypothetical protein
MEGPKSKGRLEEGKTNGLGKDSRTADVLKISVFAEIPTAKSYQRLVQGHEWRHE